MRAFAELLNDAGQEVIGTDALLEPTHATHPSIQNQHGIRLYHPFETDAIFAQSPTHAVYSMAVPNESRLLQDCRLRGISVLSLPEALNQILRTRNQLCIAGTHGKTTTSGMVYTILKNANLAPSAYIGGMHNSHRRSGVLANGGIAVIESCEYRQSFLHLNPATVVLTGIEPDHFDYFQSQADCDQTFSDFVDRISENGQLIFNDDCPRSAAIAATTRRETISISVSLNRDSDWSAVTHEAVTDRNAAKSRTAADLGQSFVLKNRLREVGLVHLKVPGLHNRFNAVAAIAAATAHGVDVETAIQGVAEFTGIQRRFEYRGNLFGIDWIDDYAHHPTAIRATLETVNRTFPGRRVIAICEPHQISRLTALFQEFASSLKLADECLILPVLPARESASGAECSRLSGKLVRSISDSGGRAFLMANLDQVLGRLDHSGRPGDVVITMGAGRTHTIHDEIHRRLQQNPAA